MTDIDFSEIDIPSYAIAPALAAANDLVDQLMLIAPLWLSGPATEFVRAELFATALAALPTPLPANAGEVLFLEGHEQRWWRLDAPRRFVDLAFADRLLFELIAGTFGLVRDRLAAEEKRQVEARRGAVPALPPLRREDSIDEDPGKLTDLIDGARFAPPDAPWPIGDKAVRQPRRPLSIGEAVAKPVVNRGGRGKSKSARDRAAGTSDAD